MDKFPVVTICGSMRFFPEMLDVASKLTTEGWVVLMPFNTSYSGGVKADATKEMLDRMHFAKIDMSERICIVASGKASPFHIGKSTEKEIAYATEHSKGVYYWTQHFGMEPA